MATGKDAQQKTSEGEDGATTKSPTTVDLTPTQPDNTKRTNKTEKVDALMAGPDDAANEASDDANKDADDKAQYDEAMNYAKSMDSTKPIDENSKEWLGPVGRLIAEGMAYIETTQIGQIVEKRLFLTEQGAKAVGTAPNN